MNRKKLKLLMSIVGLLFSTNVIANSTNIDDYIYNTDNETGITCKNLWIFDRVHNLEAYYEFPFVEDVYARTATIDYNRRKIYISNSKLFYTYEGDDATTKYVAHLIILDLHTGRFEKELPLTCDGIAITGLLCANQVGTDDAGNVWICGYTKDISTNPTKLYMVKNFDTGECEAVADLSLPSNESTSSGRIDCWDVFGDITGETSGAVCMAATRSSDKCYIYRWELAKGASKWIANSTWGTISKEITETYPSGQATWGIGATLNIINDEFFYVDGFYTYPTLYNTSLKIVESFASATNLAPDKGCNGIDEFTIKENKYIAYAEAQCNSYLKNY